MYDLTQDLDHPSRVSAPTDITIHGTFQHVGKRAQEGSRGVKARTDLVGADFVDSVFATMAKRRGQRNPLNFAQLPRLDALKPALYTSGP
jgi:hypothetical protein